MATTFKNNYDTSGVAITLTTASLTASATVGRSSTAVDNTANLYLDAEVFILAETSGAVSGDKQFLIYAYATVDGGTTYTEGITGTDAGFTIQQPTMLAWVDTVTAIGSFVHKLGPYSMRAKFGGTLPAKWGIVFINDSGVALTATAANNKTMYQGIWGSGV